MDRQQWSGVLPAITTPFRADGSVDHSFLKEHAVRMVNAGCRGIVALGSLGEANTLTFEEKTAIVSSLRDALDGFAVHEAPHPVAGVAVLRIRSDGDR